MYYIYDVGVFHVCVFKISLLGLDVNSQVYAEKNESEEE